MLAVIPSSLNAGETFSLKIAPSEKQNSLFAFIVPKKTTKKATLRNKLKRQGRHIVKNHLKSISKDVAVLIFFKKPAAELEFSDLEKKMLELFSKAKII